MTEQVVSSVWRCKPKSDFYIDKFLELLLKYECVFCELDEKEFRLSLPDNQIILFIDDFKEFKEDMSEFDIVFHIINIRNEYKAELLKLKSEGKSENDSKLPWFSKAHSLFSDKTDREDETLSHENSSVSSDVLPETPSGATSKKFQEKAKKSPSLPPMQVSSSSKTAMVTLTPIMTVSTTTTSSSFNPILMTDPKLHAGRRPLTTARDCSNANLVLKTTTGKSRLRTSGKASIVSSPYDMASNSSRICHSFTPPTATSPSSRIPLRMTAVSSNARAPLLPNTAISSARSPDVLSSRNRTTLSSTATMSSRFQIPHPPTIPSRTEVPVLPIATQWKTQVPRPGTSIFSRAKGPIFMNIQSSGVGPTLKSHRPPTSNRPGVPLSLPASSARTRVPPLNNPVSSSAGIFMPAAPSTRPVVSTSAASPYRDGVLITSAPSSTDDILASDAPSSMDGLSLIPHRDPPPYTPGVSPLHIAQSSNPAVFTPAALSSSPGVFTPAASSSSPGIFKTVDPSYSAVYTLTAPSSSPGVFTPAAPSSSPGVFTPAASSSSPGVFTPGASKSQGVFTFDAPLCRANVNIPPAPSSSDDVLTTSVPSSRDDVLTSNALSSRDVLPLMSYRDPPPYSSGDPPSSVARSFRTRVSTLQFALSSSPGGFSSATSSYRAVVNTPTASPSSDDVLTTSIPSYRDSLSSRDGLPLTPYKDPPTYSPVIPIPTVASPSRADISFLLNSPSPSGGVLLSAASFSSTGLPHSPTSPYSRAGVLSPTALSPRTRLPLSPTASPSDTGVPLYPQPLQLHLQGLRNPHHNFHH